MDKKVQKVLEEKILDILDKKNEINSITNSLDLLSSDKNSFRYGIIFGRLYNSFYYQYRRIVKRDPTEEEFSEFIQILKQHEKEFLGLSF
jgi:hypothetical protein